MSVTDSGNRRHAVQDILQELKLLDWRPSDPDICSAPHHSLNDSDKSQQIYPHTGVFFKQGNKNMLCVREHPMFKGTTGCRNQDSFFVSYIAVDKVNRFYVFCVCDGHGLSSTDEADRPGDKNPRPGNRAGDVCSRRSSMYLAELIEHTLRTPGIRQLLQKVSGRIFHDAGAAVCRGCLL